MGNTLLARQSEEKKINFNSFSSWAERWETHCLLQAAPGSAWISPHGCCSALGEFLRLYSHSQRFAGLKKVFPPVQDGRKPLPAEWIFAEGLAKGGLTPSLLSVGFAQQDSPRPWGCPWTPAEQCCKALQAPCPRTSLGWVPTRCCCYLWPGSGEAKPLFGWEAALLALRHRGAVLGARQG